MNKQQIVCIVIIGLVIVGVGIVATIIMTYNNLVTTKLEAENKWATISIQFERKIELIPQLTTLVENYTEYEQETLTLITELRTQWLNLNTSRGS